MHRRLEALHRYFGEQREPLAPNPTEPAARCRCTHEVDQAAIARALGSEATCLRCGLPISTEPEVDADGILVIDEDKPVQGDPLDIGG